MMGAVSCKNQGGKLQNAVLSMELSKGSTAFLERDFNGSFF